MSTLSVCIIAKNESEVIGRCLDCVKSFADEIVVVDTGSTDNTKKLLPSSPTRCSISSG